MRSFVFVFSLAVLLSGCTSEPAANVSVNNPVASNVNNASVSNVNPTTVENAQNGAVNLNPNAFNSGAVNKTANKYVPKPGELPYGTRNAPDESTVKAESRGKEFVETRTFANHPTLAKVEKIMDGTTTKYKVFLKNGKVLDGPADKLENMSAMSPQGILDTVGLTIKAPTDGTAVPPEKKPQ